MTDWNDAFSSMPLIAILRGIETAEVDSALGSLAGAGFRIVEIPLNSPHPMHSIAAAAKAFGERMVIGAGTVLSATQVTEVADAGGRLIVAPNFDARVAARAKELGMIYAPGVATPTEAFAAIEAGASALKLFPAEMIPPDTVKALKAVLPPDIPLVPVGGITVERMAPYWAAGARGFGLGSALYKPGTDAATIGSQAAAFAAGMQSLNG